MTIRAPKPEDAAAVAALYNHYVLHSTASFETEPLDAEQMRSRLESATARLVCERERAIVGFGYTHDWKERAAYRHTQEVTVYVAPDSTGLGIGRRLVERLVAECRTTECHALVACITADNEPSRRLFESIGFAACRISNRWGVNSAAGWTSSTTNCGSETPVFRRSGPKNPADGGKSRGFSYFCCGRSLF